MRQFHHILFVSHGLDLDHMAMKQALSLAHNTQAQLKVLLVCPPFPTDLAAYDNLYRQTLVESLQKSIAKSQQELELDPKAQTVTIEFEMKRPYGVRIIQRVIRDGHDLLIKAVETQQNIVGFRALDMELARKCPCPIWLYRTTEQSIENARIAVAIDPESDEPLGHELADELLQTADSLATSLNGQLSIITCWDYPLENTLRNSPFIGIPEAHLQTIVHEKDVGNRKALDKLIENARLKNAFQLLHQRGLPDELIPQLVTQLKIDILVMGTVGRTGIPGFIIGNTAENVLQKVNCSLVALKPNGFISPVQI